MRRRFACVLVSLVALAASSQQSSIQALNEPIQPGMIDISGVTVSTVLPIYRDLSGAELVVSSEVKRLVTPVTIGPAGPLKKEEAMKLIEKELLDQAGVLITKLDKTRISVTHNDALPTTPVTPHTIR